MATTDSTVTVDLGPWADEVDRYAAARNISRRAAVLALVRDALTNPGGNRIDGEVHGTVVQARDVQHGIDMRRL